MRQTVASNSYRRIIYENDSRITVTSYLVSKDTFSQLRRAISNKRLVTHIGN